MDIWNKSALGTGNGKCKGPEVGTWLACSKLSREVSVARRERLRGTVGGQQVKQKVGARLPGVLWALMWSTSTVKGSLWLPAESGQESSWETLERDEGRRKGVECLPWVRGMDASIGGLVGWRHQLKNGGGSLCGNVTQQCFQRW